MSMDALKAFQLAAKLHWGQVDKAGCPYIEHLTRVFLRVQAGGGDVMQQIAALLHDSIEDGKATAEQLILLGVPEQALGLISVLTKPKGQDYADYLAHVKSVPRALLVKLADLEDNSDPERLAALPDAVAQRLLLKYEQAAQYLGHRTL